MKTTDRNSFIVFPVLPLIGLGVAWAGSQGGNSFSGIPLFGLAVALTFLIQWLAFIPAYFLQTEKFYDLTGSVTFIAVSTVALFLSGPTGARAILVWAMVVVWALRLGSFLFARIRKAGKDDRFDEIKPSFIRFLNVWTIQALWVTFTASAALVTITTTHRQGLDLFAIIGVLVWLTGFGLEAAADLQKSRFNTDPANKGKFIQTGLWSRSRHPNYFGEILIWVGVALVALPVLEGWQWVALLSPLFVALLLTRVSGVPLLEAKADKKWGGRTDYEEYKRRTPVLIPRL